MREFTVPALATEPQVGGLADVVFEYADESPALAVLARKDERGEWQDVSAAQFRDEVVALAKGLLAEGVRFGDRVALMSRTRYEWTLLDFALWAIGAQSVPVYPTSSAEQVAWMLHDAEVSAAIVEHEDHAMTVGSVIDGLPRLKRLWQLNSGALAELTAAGAHIEDEVVHRHRLALTPDTVATVIYTSGTTGRPKGCVITHANFMAEADNIVARYDQVFNAKSGEQGSLLLFLPLAHVFGRMVEIAALRGRVKLGHQPDMSARALMPDLKSFRPTFVQAVPHLFEKIFRGARRKAEAEGLPAPSTRPSISRSGMRRPPSARRSAPVLAPAPAARAAPGLRPARLHQAARGHGRQVPLRHVRRLRHGAAARAVLRRRWDADLRGLRPHRVHGRCRGQPARAAPLRHGGAAGARHERADRRGRGDPAARRPDLRRLSEQPPRLPGVPARGLADHRRPGLAG